MPNWHRHPDGCRKFLSSRSRYLRKIVRSYLQSKICLKLHTSYTELINKDYAFHSLRVSAKDLWLLFSIPVDNEMGPIINPIILMLQIHTFGNFGLIYWI